jgi:hypothetical protein
MLSKGRSPKTPDGSPEITPPERLFAADQRLDAVQQAVNLVSAALEGFYATLDDKQKTQFEAIGPKRTANF